MTRITCMSKHVVAFAISFTRRAVRPEFVTTCYIVRDIMAISAVARAVGWFYCPTKTCCNMSRHVYDPNHSSSNGRCSMLPPNLRESSSTRIVIIRISSISCNVKWNTRQLKWEFQYIFNNNNKVERLYIYGIVP